MDDSTGSDDQISASRFNLVAFRTTKQEQQERWNQRAQDRQAHQNFLEEHRGTGKFSGKYAPQPQQTELIWTMPWGCWVELEDKDVHCKDWESVQAWILKAGSGWHQAETAEDPQNMNKFAAGSLVAVTAHRIKWILSGRLAVKQTRH